MIGGDEQSRRAIVTLRDAEVRYRNGVLALQRTTLAFDAGQFVVLLGSSGAGKSSLLRSLNGLVAPTAGDVEHAGLGSVSDRRRLRVIRKQCGMIFQQHQLVRRLSALGNVCHGRLPHHSAWRSLLPLGRAERRFALACLARVGLFAKAEVRVDQLSGGEQQRVGIARALAQQPRLLLADEPIASLDPATAHDLLTLLRGISRRDGMLTIVSLHQVDLAREFADRIVGLRHGRVVFDGVPDALTREVLDEIYGPASSCPADALAATFSLSL